ncbi:MAG: NADH-quinone oxidoreductase subunit C, partial [Gammaproteobacteria bacterium]
MSEATVQEAAAAPAVVEELRERFGDECLYQPTVDDIPTVWVPRERISEVMGFVKNDIERPYPMLYDLSAIDERVRTHREGQPDSDFTVFYQLTSIDRNEDLRIKVALAEHDVKIPSVTSIYRAANWYEREAFDMFGLDFQGHPNLYRILTPANWEGHPLRKDHPARATEMDPFTMTEEFEDSQQEALRFVPEQWGMSRRTKHTDFMFLNMGPNHPSVHGVFRVALQLDGEIIVDAVPDIGYHHRASEKMGERQSWHTYIPYTDRIDYLGGVMNNLPYVMAVEKMAGIEVPDRAKVIRIMLCEMFRIQSHLLFYGTYAQDVGQMSPVFYMFVDRERLFSIIEAITGGRMHPSWFRIGGVAQDLPEGWDTMVRDF